MKKIVVYTGSFNPITKGHLLTMNAAIDAVNADEGRFIITPNKHLSLKMVFKVKTNFILSEDVRKEMIESLSKENNKLFFGGKEVGGVSPSTVKTINGIKRKNKDAELYLLIGADKLSKIPRWNNINSIINTIMIIVAVRKGIDINQVISNDEWLTNHKDRLIIINPDPIAFDISSTEVRRRFFNGENYDDLMNEGPCEILKRFNPNDYAEVTD